MLSLFGMGQPSVSSTLPERFVQALQAVEKAKTPAEQSAAAQALQAEYQKLTEAQKKEVARQYNVTPWGMAIDQHMRQPPSVIQQVPR